MKNGVRVNVHPAAYGRGEVLKAEKELAARLKRLQVDRGYEGTIDIDYFDSDAGAYAALIIEVFDEHGDMSEQFEYREVYPVSDISDRDENEEAAESIRRAMPKIVSQLDDYMTAKGNR